MKYDNEQKLLEFSSAYELRQKRAANETSSSFTGSGSSIVDLKQDKDGKLIVKVGHVGAVKFLPNDDKILEIARTQLIQEGILGKDFDFEIISKSGCGDAFEGVAVAAQMYHQDGVRAFIGPYCNTELDAVAKMASFWNIPVISYMPTTTAMVDRTIYKTLARISSKNTNSIAHGVLRLVQHFKWQKVAIVTNTGPVAYERTAAFEDEFKKYSITVVKKVMFEENADSNEMLKSGQLTELANSARVIICLFSLTRELTREFMQATFKANMNNAEFVYILPWLQSGTKDSSPWIGSSGEMLQQVKDHYRNAIIVDDVNGFDDTIVTGFTQKIVAFGLKPEDIDTSNIFGYFHLYDSLKLYALAARQVLETNNKNASVITNGRLIWNSMRRLSFDGIGMTLTINTTGNTGVVAMDDLGDRAPIFAAFYISPNRDKVMKIVHMDFVVIPNCDGVANKTGCYDLANTLTGFWPSENGIMPLDEPACGFRGQRCSYTLEIVVGATVLALVILFLVTFLIYRYCQNLSLAKMHWRIMSAELRIIDDEQARSLLSLGSANTKLSNMSTGMKRHALLGAIHENLNPFLGLVFNEKEELLIIWKFCSRGTVQDIIYNKSMVLDEKMHSAFVRDITLGLEYLHSSQIGYHGSLTPWSCVIDRNWSVRLTDYGIANPLERWEKHGSIIIEALQSDDDKSQAAQRTSALYQAPEMLKNRESNKQRRSDQRWIAQTQARRQAGDIYAFGMLLYEIMFRSLPYPEGTDLTGLIDAVSDGSRHIRPQIQDEMKLHPDLVALLIDCWSSNPEIRPSIRRVRLNTEMVLKIKGSLVDQMMRVMETYANNLEKIVKERTGIYVANELKAGRPVPPKLFSSATVMFSDVVGFSEICDNSTPLEIVNLLNGLYSGFDEIIKRNHAYKVETIGDSYLVVSGVPEENGTRHVMHISDIALEMRKYLKTFEVPHKKGMKVKCRWGFSTGAVATGVVGMTAPRYCLFGDTVNLASRMESTGLPELIQMSQNSQELLRSTYPNFACSLRGQVEVKGAFAKLKINKAKV
ncbi:Guanylate cyclase [Aphelenchoides bicaudatus]|nr:Guanylate cyclase [Aphelenchoides bicaudatus]